MQEQELIEHLNQQLPDNCSLQGLCGVGGQGRIFRGQINQEDIALKLFQPDADPERLRREIEVLRSIDCPNLVKVIEVFEIELSGGYLTAVAYEFLPGGDLKKFIDPSQAKVPNDEIIEVGLQIGNAIEQLWRWKRSRVVHRDIKPTNIMEAEPGRFVLVDLGFARLVDLSDLTARGLVPGTQGYMSPEQAYGRRNLTHKSDIFSLGVTMFEVATRVHPFAKNQIRIMSGNHENLETYRPDLPWQLVNLIHRMMSHRSVERPGDIAGQFEQLKGGE